MVMSWVSFISSGILPSSKHKQIMWWISDVRWGMFQYLWWDAIAARSFAWFNASLGQYNFRNIWMVVKIICHRHLIKRVKCLVLKGTSMLCSWVKCSVHLSQPDLSSRVCPLRSFNSTVSQGVGPKAHWPLAQIPRQWYSDYGLPRDHHHSLHHMPWGTKKEICPMFISSQVVTSSDHISVLCITTDLAFTAMEMQRFEIRVYSPSLPLNKVLLEGNGGLKWEFSFFYVDNQPRLMSPTCPKWLVLRWQLPTLCQLCWSSLLVRNSPTMWRQGWACSQRLSY